MESPSRAKDRGPGARPNGSGSVLAERERREAANPDVLPHLRDGFLDDLFHRLLVVANVRLLHEHDRLIEFVHLAFEDPRNHRLRLALVLELLAIDDALTLHELGRHALAAHGQRARARDLHGEIAHQALELVGAGHEVGLAVHLDEHADPAAGMDVGLDQSFAGLAPRLRIRLGDALLAQVLDRLVHVARALRQCLLALHHADTGSAAELLHQFRRDLGQPFLPRRTRHGPAQTAPAAWPWGSVSSSPPNDTVSDACGSAGGRSLATRWPSSTASETMRAKSAMARIASSLPGIGYWIASGSQLVSTMPTMGMPRRFASATAIFSFFVSTTKRS